MESKFDIITQSLCGFWLALVCALAINSQHLSLLIPFGVISFLFRKGIKQLVNCPAFGFPLVEAEAAAEKQHELKANAYQFTNSALSCLHSVTVLVFFKLGLVSEEVLMVASSGYYIYDLYDIIRYRLYKSNIGVCSLTQSCVLLIFQVVAVQKGFDVCYENLLLPVMLHCIIVSLQQMTELYQPKSRLHLLGVFSFASWVFFLFGRIKLSIVNLVAVVSSYGLMTNQGIMALSIASLNLILLTVKVVGLLTSTSPYREPDFEGKEQPVAPNHWKIHGQCYDLTNFADKHPGGKHALDLGRGRECTALFESYHPFTTKHLAVLRKYATSEEQYQKTLERHKSDKFYQTLRTRVKAFIEEENLNTKASGARMAYYATILTAFWVSYFFFYLGGFWCGPFLVATFGWLCGSFGHDGSHFSISTNPTINYLGNFLGMAPITSPIIWLSQHTYAHHSFTNDFEHDPDLHHFSFLRSHHRYPWMKRYSSQATRVYVYMWYVFFVLGSAMWIPIKTLMNHTLHDITDLSMLRKKDWIRVVVHLGLFTWMVLVQPFFSLEGPGAALLTGLVCLMLQGLYFGFFTQVNHLDDLSITAAEKKSNKSSWAATQVETSNNFCTDSKFWTCLSNGLNYQIEHHLFPGINHEKLSMISPIVKATCDEFGVSYQNYPTTRSILSATAKYFKGLAFPVLDASDSSSQQCSKSE